MNEPVASAENLPGTSTIPTAAHLKWRDRHKKLYQCILPISGLLLGMALGIGLLIIVTGPMAQNNKLSAPAIVGFAFFAAAITWVGGFLGMILGYVALIAERLADDSKTAQ